MQSLKIFHHSIAFLLELIMLVALGIAGYHFTSTVILKYTFMIGLPLIVAVLWFVWAAPKSKHRIIFPWLHLFKLLLFTIAAVFLYKTGYFTAAIIFGVVANINECIAFLFKYDARLDAANAE